MELDLSLNVLNAVIVHQETRQFTLASGLGPNRISSFVARGSSSSTVGTGGNTLSYDRTKMGQNLTTLQAPSGIDGCAHGHPCCNE